MLTQIACFLWKMATLKHNNVVNRKALSLLNCLHYFCKSPLSFGLWVDCWVLLPASTLWLLWCVVWLKDMKDPGWQRYVVGKGKTSWTPWEYLFDTFWDSKVCLCFIIKTSYWPKKKEAKKLLRDSTSASELIRTNVGTACMVGACIQWCFKTWTRNLDFSRG